MHCLSFGSISFVSEGSGGGGQDGYSDWDTRVEQAYEKGKPEACPTVIGALI
jgi:hypothetical protein